jgi:biopolymer transport protein ExbB
MQNQLGLSHFWQNADSVSHSVAYLLLAMSLISWFIIFKKIFSVLQSKKAAKFVALDFWNSTTLADGSKALSVVDSSGIFSGLAAKAVQAAALQPSSELVAQFDKEALITRTLRQEINASSAQMESGLTILASVGSVSPFVGLFGTVWGIYHALINIAANGQVLIDKVAGPVGEALIMTAAGLAVAIPAVLAYNAFVRANRVTQAQLDSFAYDLLGVLTAGKRVSN